MERRAGGFRFLPEYQIVNHVTSNDSNPALKCHYNPYLNKTRRELNFFFETTPSSSNYFKT